MSNKVYAKSEIVGSSSESIDDAIRNAISTAGKSLKNLDWFEVTEIRGYIDGDQVKDIQVSLKVGFRYEQKK